MQTNDIEWQIANPPTGLTDFVESFWMLANHSDKAHQIVILPDGYYFFFIYKKYFSRHTKGIRHGARPNYFACSHAPLCCKF